MTDSQYQNSKKSLGADMTNLYFVNATITNHCQSFLETVQTSIKLYKQKLLNYTCK